MTTIRDIPSPNFGPRRGVTRPDMVVLHYTGMHSAEAAIARLCDPEAEVSAHYVVARDGGITRLVDDRHRAWHAGRSYWRGARDVNSHSIGIEIDNAGPLEGFPPFPHVQMRAIIVLLRMVMDTWRIPPGRVVGHQDIAPARKIDPGPKFDWSLLARIGLAEVTLPDGLGDGERDAHTIAAALGYDPGASPDALQAALVARRWRVPSA